MNRVRVGLPPHLRHLAEVRGEVEVTLGDPPTIGALLDALEADHPVLRGTIRDHGVERRRPLIRFFACGQDLSHEPWTTVLPQEVAEGREAFNVVGAIAGG